MRKPWLALPLLSCALMAAEQKEMKNSLGMELILIPAGEFQMGCSPGDRQCGGDEKPSHLIKITRPFYLGKYEVTQEQWQTLMGSNPSYFNEGSVGADWKKHPVEQVSWNLVQEFVLSYKTTMAAYEDTERVKRLIGESYAGLIVE